MLIRVLNSYPAHRAFVAGLSFGAAIIAARTLSPEQFSTVMTIAFVAKFLQITNFGATSGFLVSSYSGRGLLAQHQVGAEQRFLLFFLVQLSCVGTLILGVAFLWLPQYFAGCVAFLLLSPLFVMEPVLRYRHFFSFSLAPEVALSLALLALVMADWLGAIPFSSSSQYLAVTALLSAAMLLIVLRRFGGVIKRQGKLDFGVRDYGRVLVLGGPVYLGSALFLVASSTDRLILPLYGSDAEVGVYFLAHQLCMGSMIFLTAINFSNTVNLGEAFKESASVHISVILKRLRVAALVALCSYFALGAGGALLELIFLPSSFEGLLNIVLPLGAGLSVFYISNAVTPVAAYYGRQFPLTVAMAFVSLALLLNNALVYWLGLSFVWLAVGTALAFTFYGFFAIGHAFDTVNSRAPQKQ